MTVSREGVPFDQDRRALGQNLSRYVGETTLIVFFVCLFEQENVEGDKKNS